MVVVVKSETWRCGHENGRRWHDGALTVDNPFMHADFSVTEAGRKRWWSKLQGSGPGWYRDLDRGHFVRCSYSCGGFFRVCEVTLGQDVGFLCFHWACGTVRPAMENVVDYDSGDMRKTKCGRRKRQSLVSERHKAWSVKDTKRGRRKRQSVVKERHEAWPVKDAKRGQHDRQNCGQRERDKAWWWLKVVSKA